VGESGASGWQCSGSVHEVRLWYCESYPQAVMGTVPHLCNGSVLQDLCGVRWSHPGVCTAADLYGFAQSPRMVPPVLCLAVCTQVLDSRGGRRTAGMPEEFVPRSGSSAVGSGWWLATTMAMRSTLLPLRNGHRSACGVDRCPAGSHAPVIICVPPCGAAGGM
jgi:hypothetical protein